jgi:hypothetical protein
MDRDPYSLTLKIEVGGVINNLDFSYLTMIDSAFTANGSATTTLTTCTSTRRAKREGKPGALTGEKLGAERRGQ